MKVWFAIAAFGMLSMCGGCGSSVESGDAEVPDSGGIGTKDSMMAYLDAAISGDTTNMELYYNRAKYYIGRKQYQSALIDMTRCIATDSLNTKYYITYADILFFAGQPYMSKKALERALQLNMADKEALFKMGQLLFYVREYDAALGYNDRLYAIDAGDEKNLFLRGMIYKEKGDTVLAIRTFQQVSENNNMNYESLMQLGIIFGARNNKLAKQYYESALRVRPQSIEAMYGLAMYYQNIQMYDEAIQQYTAINEIDANFKDAYFNIGYIHLVHLKAYKQAIPFFDKAIHADSLYYQAFYNRGYCRELLGDINAARTDYQKALDANPAYEKSREALKRVGL